ncbi:putative heme-binding domain-containing protein [Prosthecobacter fusiformis]|uniref:Putative heme-binding domain-containing protein n=1 Tax=Prosthecobacter fusiformis TaxID=48464 RepID=A0A4R7S4P5_9BACT|nr:c-type cytochrome [Prosthecobacter fusiformis]TDU73412.1 putative heme-binding domain-containing protein [Prosthecobacter fusiformis]
MTCPARFFVILTLLTSSALHAEPQWIWSSKKAAAQEKVTFKHSFTLKLTPKSASLSLTCDNGATAFINGKQVAVNPDWQKPVKVDVIKALEVGAVNVIEVRATNKGGSAGMIAKLELEKQQGGAEVIETSGEWQATPTGKTEWKPVAVLGAYGIGPWGKVFDGKAGSSKKDAPVIAAAGITVPAGFKVELLYSVPKEEQGSWVALTTDDKGHLIACDQYGSIYRMAVPAIGKTELLKPEKLKLDFGKAHGLLYAFNSLYVMVNENGKENGLYRLKDTDGDDQYDKVEKLINMGGAGEHGLHSMTLSPDGKRIFFNAGNSSELPAELTKSRPAKLWGEDHVLPRMWDANGHARGRMAPGGFICSMDADGKDVELFCYGFRNEFDITFDLSGELFTYDADMEWDIGSPWYRPTRVNHCVSGADYGWRSGSGKWPGYYPDSLPTTLDIGPGSPTGVVSGKGAKFPAKYQRAVFINDWTYGTMWAINLQPKGGSFVAEKEEFVFGKPLPLTDVIIHPQDGAMYFAVGGRRTQSGVYRVIYAGKESTAPVEALPMDEEAHTRLTLETLHAEGGDPQKTLATAWPYLSHSDRHVRYAARVAIEKLPKDLWQEKALAETQPMAVIEGIIALARVNGTKSEAPSEKPAAGSSSPSLSDVAPENVELQLKMLETLSRLEGAELSLNQHLGALRALQLVFTRLGKPAPEVCEAIVEKLEPLFPSENESINRELCQILIALDSTQAPAKTIALMATAKDDFQAVATDAVLSRNDGYANAARAAAGSRPNSQQIAYMFALRNAKAGWTPELRKTFFSWFPRARTWKGGNSFKGFIENIRKDSLATFVPESELAELDAISSKVEGADIPNYVAPKGPGKAWSVDEVVALTSGGLKGRDFKNGEAMYRSVMCATCHRFNGDGGSIGPDLTGSGNRYTMRDLMENIVDPSKVISDQYDSHQITKKDGSTILGRIVVEENGKVFVMANPFAPNDQLAINVSEIASKETRQVSMMPPGLINALNQDELLDLIAYLISGGNEQDKVFK